MRALHWRGFWLSGGAALVLFVTYLCLRPSTGGEQLFPNADKWAHFLAFFALAGMLLALVERRYYASVCLGLLAFGGAIEIAQYLLPYGRSAEWLDLAADGVGIVAGWLVSVPFRESWLQRIERWVGARG
jgi:VanZ family protein